MLLEINPHELDQQATLQTSTTTSTDDGQKIPTWSGSTAVRFKWLEALRTQATEKIEGSKAVAKQRRTMLMRKESRSIGVANTRFVVSSENWYVEAVRPYKGSRNWLAVDVWQSDR